MKKLTIITLVLFTLACNKQEEVIPTGNDLASDTAALIDIFNTNPDNTLSWDINATNISDWEGIIITDDRVTSLKLSNKNITNIPPQSLYGLDNLTSLFADNNTISSIDLSKSVALVRLEMFNNELTSLDISNNPLLEILTIETNNLTSIDVRSLPALRSFKAHSNNFQNKIYISNGNNSNMVRMEVQNNPDLVCIQVDNGATNGFAGWGKDDDTASYNTICN